MRFSVCIPNYNYGRYLRRTIDSVLAQTHTDLEVLVSDNASTDDSVEIVQSYDERVRLRRNRRNVGFAGNLDRAATMATGDVLILLSSDDLMRPGALATYEALYADSAKPERLVVGSTVDVIDANDDLIGTIRASEHARMWGDAAIDERTSAAAGAPTLRSDARGLLRHSLLAMRNPFNFATLAYPRSLYEATEGYGGGRLNNPDKWFAWHLLDHAEVALWVEAPLFAYRVHDSNQASIVQRTGALKRMVDQYVSTFEIDQGLLDRAGVTREQLERAFVEEDVVLRGLLDIANGRRADARRGLRLGLAAYPGLVRSNPRAWALRGLLALGPVGTAVARRARPRRAGWVPVAADAGTDPRTMTR